ncbi:hypothetical protein C1646_754579 [Rhizophagus diaphanus]|nr:hypothetical protein C1646_754579 [Rhizophagus diaphanus] [Rhizophagus sp. MUCL 43196]
MIGAMKHYLVDKRVAGTMKHYLADKRVIDGINETENIVRELDLLKRSNYICYVTKNKSLQKSDLDSMAQFETIRVDDLQIWEQRLDEDSSSSTILNKCNTVHGTRILFTNYPNLNNNSSSSAIQQFNEEFFIVQQIQQQFFIVDNSTTRILFANYISSQDISFIYEEPINGLKLYTTLAIVDYMMIWMAFEDEDPECMLPYFHLRIINKRTGDILR